jgi:hypothetical protein
VSVFYQNVTLGLLLLGALSLTSGWTSKFGRIARKGPKVRNKQTA